MSVIDEYRKGFIRDRLRTYPFLVKQEYIEPPLKPQVVEAAFNIDVLRVPFGKGQPIVWGFETEKDRSRFLTNFGGKAIEADQV